MTVERYYDEYDNCETAFGMDANASTCFLDLNVGLSANRWGWTNYYEEEGEYTVDLWAGAAKCGPENGALVGTATIDYSDGEVYVTYNMDGDGNWFNYVMNEAHVYVGAVSFNKGVKAPCLASEKVSETRIDNDLLKIYTNA